MQELINQVSQRTGLPADKARTAVDTVVGYLKQQLPGPIANQLDGAVGGAQQGGTQGGAMGQAADKIGGMFGKK